MPIPHARATSRRALLLAIAGLTLALPARAVNADLGYSRVQVFSGALRYLRIDLGYEITEQDAEAAYLLFRYKAEGLAEPRFGAFEIIETKTGVRLWVKLPQMPSYHEQVLKDGLVKKLRLDYGDPERKPEPPSKPPGTKPTPSDAAPKPSGTGRKQAPPTAQ
jgi:hypothetical protein